MCLLFETIRVEKGTVFNLPYHQQRVNKNSSIILNDIIEGVIFPTDNDVYKLRISYDEHDAKDVSITKYTPRDVNSLLVVKVDDTFDYSCKKEDRTALNTLFEQRGNCDDILISQNGYITDTSICNILFFDGKEWVTPHKPLLEGTCRQRLLNEGLIKKATITTNDITKFKGFMTINAMLDFDKKRLIDIKNIKQHNSL